MSQPQQVMQPSAARAAFPPHQAHSPSTQPAYPPMPIAMPPNQFQNGRSKISPGPNSPQIAPNSASPAVTPGIGSPNIGIPPPSVQHQRVNYQSHQSQSNAYQNPQFPQQTVRLPTSTAPASQSIGSIVTTQAMSPSVHPHPLQYHQPSPHPQSPHPQSPNLNQQAYHNYATFQPLPSGTMGPPTNPSGQDVSRQATPATVAPPKKTFAYDMDDTLLGTGINLEEEEQYMNDFDTKNGFGAFAPGGRGSFYGAGPANQKPDSSNAKTQEELAAEAADWAWNQAARRLAISRTQEMKDQFLAIPNIYVRMDSIAKSYGLELNEELKPDPQPQTQYLRATPINNPKAAVNVQFQKAPDGTMVRTSGCFLPKTAYLADQLALLSLATKERLGEMLSDANKVATYRQQTAHGAIPPEWMDAATIEPPAIKDARALGEPDMLDSAVSPRTNPLKRPAKEISNGLPTPVSEAFPTNPLVDTIVSAGKQVRDAEEARLRKRQKRLEEAAETEKKDDGASASRSGSLAPGTPGSVAPESESKTMSKKESKKMSKLAEMTSSTVNSTVSQFMGSKKKKRYSWMTSGAGGIGSGATTPRMPGPAGTPSAGNNRTRGPLTNPGAHSLGQFREDSEKGKNIQLRDWIFAMEQRGVDKRTLQEAYNRLDRSDTGDKVATPCATAVNGAGKA